MTCPLVTLGEGDQASLGGVGLIKGTCRVLHGLEMIREYIPGR